MTRRLLGLIAASIVLILQQADSVRAFSDRSARAYIELCRARNPECIAIFRAFFAGLGYAAFVDNKDMGELERRNRCYAAHKALDVNRMYEIISSIEVTESLEKFSYLTVFHTISHSKCNHASN